MQHGVDSPLWITPDAGTRVWRSRSATLNAWTYLRAPSSRPLRRRQYRHNVQVMVRQSSRLRPRPSLAVAATGA
jgi:hypothetical protein